MSAMQLKVVFVDVHKSYNIKTLGTNIIRVKPRIDNMILLRKTYAIQTK
jgi:hypothetical protein